jgi:glycosyltransferase involved in cell wall biosynthesis
MDKGPGSLHVVRPAAGGIRRHVSDLAAGLASRGLGVEIAAPPDFSLALPPGATVPLRPVPLSARPHPLRDLQAARACAAFSRSLDLVHGHGLRGAWIGALAVTSSRKPLLFTAHNLAPAATGLSRLLLKSVIRRAARVICVSRSVAETLAPYGLTPEKSVVIPNGVDPALFTRDVDRDEVLRQAGLSLPAAEGWEAPLVVTAVGRLAPEKGFDLLVEAAALAAREADHIYFLLAGAGPEEARLHELIARHGLAARFVLAGYAEDVPAILRASDIVAVPSRQEGQGLAALEAMAAGLPVVAARVGGLVETVQDGATGWLFEPGDPTALAAEILRLARDRRMRSQIGDAARSLVEEAYTLDRMIERTIQVYGDVLDG